MAVPALTIRITRSKKRQQLLSRFKDMQREVKQSSQSFKRTAVKEFERVVENPGGKPWQHKPKFVGGVFITPNGDKISLVVEPIGPDAKYWEWTSRGTKPHIITARNAPTLYFRGSYDAKTKAGNPPTYGGSGKSSGAYVRKLEVQHPGTTPRLFEEAIGKTLQREWKRTVENAIRRGVRKAG